MPTLHGTNSELKRQETFFTTGIQPHSSLTNLNLQRS